MDSSAGWFNVQIETLKTLYIQSVPNGEVYEEVEQAVHHSHCLHIGSI